MLTAAVLVAAVATYLAVGRGDSIAAERGVFAGIDAARAVDAVGDAPPSTVLVHVSGAVVSPGIVELESGARVADAVAAAGGATRSANLSAINLASAVGDGDQIVVPGIGDAVAVDPSGETAGGTPGRVMLNSATVAQLMGLPGIGPVLAERIVRHREQNGPFAEVEDLLDVTGIGEAKLLELRELVDI
jgi:competence protein ComEA